MIKKSLLYSAIVTCWCTLAPGSQAQCSGSYTLHVGNFQQRKNSHNFSFMNFFYNEDFIFKKSA